MLITMIIQHPTTDTDSTSIHNILVYIRATMVEVVLHIVSEVVVVVEQPIRGLVVPWQTTVLLVEVLLWVLEAMVDIIKAHTTLLPTTESIVVAEMIQIH